MRQRAARTRAIAATAAVAGVLSASPLAVQVPPDGRPLQTAVPATGSLATGETHTYRLRLDAGQFARIVLDRLLVEPPGLFVSLALSDPQGQPVVSSARNHAMRPEVLMVFAERAGDHVVTVEGIAGGAGRGDYRLRIDALRAGDAADRHRALGARATAAGEALRARATAASLREAVVKVRESLGHWEAAGERGEEALAFSYLGSLHFQLSAFREALEYHGRALSLYRAVDDRLGESEALNNLAVARYSLGELEPASRLFLEAIAAKRAVGDRQGESSALNNLGSVYWAMGDPEEAIAAYREALPLRRALGDRAGEARTLNNIGTVHQDIGEYQRALEAYLESLALRRAVGDRVGEATSLNNLGVLHHGMGRAPEALAYFDEALRLRRAAGNRAGEAATLGAMAEAHRSLGDLAKVVELSEQALALSRDTGDRRRQAHMLNQLGSARAALGREDLAVQAHRDALALCEAAGDRRCQADAVHGVAAMAASRGDTSAALEHFERALALRRATADARGEAEARLGMARVERARGRLAEARVHADATLALVESERARIPGGDFRSTYFALRQDAFSFAIDLLMALHERRPGEGHDLAALEVSERGRARSLLDTLAESGEAVRERGDPALAAEERALRQRLGAVDANRLRHLADADGESRAAAADREIDRLLTTLREVRARIRAHNPGYAALVESAPLSVAEIREATLDEETALLEYALGTERSFAWLVTRQSVESVALPPRAEIESAARRALELLAVSHTRQRRRESQLALEALARLVLEPIAGRLAASRLVVVADGALQYVPFGALPMGAAPLVARVEVVSLPSASTAAALRRERSDRRDVPGVAAVLADPVLDAADPRVQTGGSVPAREARAGTPHADLVRSARDAGVTRFERLEFTRREAEAILRLAGESPTLSALDFDASRETAIGADLARYRIVHFATHGLINARHPELSGIVLSLVDERGRPRDGFLRLHDIYNLRLRADLVVLSACRTALGEEIRGEGLVGLVRGFMYAGAPTVVASLWEVRDEATAELMTRFYRAVLRDGLTPAAALRRAQISMWKEERWRAPYYWAAFVLQGDWR